MWLWKPMAEEFGGDLEASARRRALALKKVLR
jgi:hypothetical protein